MHNTGIGIDFGNSHSTIAVFDGSYINYIILESNNKLFLHQLLLLLIVITSLIQDRQLWINICQIIQDVLSVQ